MRGAQRGSSGASMTTHYLPNADEPTLQPFTRAFVDMMFAHAAFEHRVSDLMEVVTGVKGFGERPENQWKMDDRPKRMRRLIKEYRRYVLPETEAIVACLKRSISFYHTRNLLAHGVWWRFNMGANAITVRSRVARSNHDQHRTLKVADINLVATSLDALEVELWKLQTAIEARPKPVRRKPGPIRAFWRWLSAR